MKNNQKLIFVLTVLICCLCFAEFNCFIGQQNFEPGKRTLLDAHNCYPYHGQWFDRLNRALACGFPLAVEQDLVWFADSLSGKSRSIIAHGEPYSGNEPTLREYFFERIRPIIEKEMQSSDKSNWPLIILNLDFKTNVRDHYVAIWKLLNEYQDWLCTAKRLKNKNKVAPLGLRPILVLTGQQNSQEIIFHDSVKVGEKLLLFGAIQTVGDSVEVPPETMAPKGQTNYRRWWNNSWSVVEKDRYNNQWSKAEKVRLQALVDRAHQLGLWIRFYTLDGYQRDESMGWSDSYNFGSIERVSERWRAAIDCGVDFIATDQYEILARLLQQYQ